MEQYLNAFVTFVVGFVALVVYRMQKSAELSDASNIILMDIRHAEQAISHLLERQVIDKNIKPLLVDNNWAKYKHLFASRFSQDDFEAFNRFFFACAAVSDAHKRMSEVFYAGILAKAAYIQQQLMEVENPESEDGKLRREFIINRASKEEYLFDPNEPKTIVMSNLNALSRLSTTVAFHKLSRMAAKKSMWRMSF